MRMTLSGSPTRPEGVRSLVLEKLLQIFGLLTDKIDTDLEQSRRVFRFSFLNEGQ